MGDVFLYKTKIGHCICEVRLPKGCSRKRIAEIVGTGEVYLGKIERDLKIPSLNSLIQIVEALYVAIIYLPRNPLASGKEYIFIEIT